LFIGGTGIMSSACAELAVERGQEVTVLNRGATTKRRVPDGVEVLRGDVRDAESTRSALAGREFDVAVDWVAYTPDHVRQDVALFAGRVLQYVFISSASAYQTPPARLPVVESTPLRNPFWQYSRDKIACEQLLSAAYREDGEVLRGAGRGPSYGWCLTAFRPHQLRVKPTARSSQTLHRVSGCAAMPPLSAAVRGFATATAR
jgi:nucleoside-diphosphate-sugar epimerase